MDERGEKYKAYYPGPDVQGWFHHADQVLELLEMYRPKVCVELGAWLGSSAIPIAKMIEKWDGHLVCVDHYKGSDSFPKELMEKMGRAPADFARNLHRYGVFNCSLRVGDSTKEANTFDDKSIDFVYVDADHTFEGCLRDLQAWYPKLKKGGLMAGDDYGVERFGVTKAWDVFTHMLSVDEVGYQNGWAREGLVWLVKR